MGTKQQLREKRWSPDTDHQAKVLLVGYLACEATTSTKSAHQQRLKINWLLSFQMHHPFCKQTNIVGLEFQFREQSLATKV